MIKLYFYIGLNKVNMKIEFLDVNNIYFDWIYYSKINNLNLDTELESWKHYQTEGKFDNLRYYNLLESNFPTD